VNSWLVLVLLLLLLLKHWHRLLLLLLVKVVDQPGLILNDVHGFHLEGWGHFYFDEKRNSTLQIFIYYEGSHKQDIATYNTTEFFVSINKNVVFNKAKRFRQFKKPFIIT
jgi:hypothetical protein